LNILWNKKLLNFNEKSHEWIISISEENKNDSISELVRCFDRIDNEQHKGLISEALKRMFDGVFQNLMIPFLKHSFEKNHHLNVKTSKEFIKLVTSPNSSIGLNFNLFHLFNLFFIFYY